MGNRISDFRRMRGMSLDDLSEASGLSKSTLSELERGITKPMLDSARRIASALDAYESELWPEDSTMPLTVRTTDTALAAAEARIAELESYNFGLATESHQQQERIVALEKVLERIKARSDAYVDADAPMNPDSSVQVISDICAAALLKEKE